MRCYLVEDEEHLNILLSYSLEQEGYEVRGFHGYLDAQERLGDVVDAWIVDINLPDGSGLDLVKQLKESDPNQVVLIISARDSEIDKLTGLEIGSDDYITKPFLPKELNIRLGRLLQNRSSGGSIRRYGKLSLDYSKRMAYVDREILDLTSREFDLVEMFSTHPNQAFSREQILDAVWGVDYFGSDRVVDDLVRRIRKKCEQVPIETVYGYGYRWRYREE